MRCFTYIRIVLIDPEAYYFFGIEREVFANGSGDWGALPGRVVPKTKTMVFDAFMLNTQHSLGMNQK